KITKMGNSAIRSTDTITPKAKIYGVFSFKLECPCLSILDSRLPGCVSSGLFVIRPFYSSYSLVFSCSTASTTDSSAGSSFFFEIGFMNLFCLFGRLVLVFLFCHNRNTPGFLYLSLARKPFVFTAAIRLKIFCLFFGPRREQVRSLGDRDRTVMLTVRWHAQV